MPLLLIVAGLLVIALGVALKRDWEERLLASVDMPYDEELRVDTPDGSAFELRRLPGPPGQPVVMVHGIAANHRNVDFHPDCSLARYLRAAGRDVWLVTLRSGRADRGFAEPVRFYGMVDHDVPMAVAEVRRRTGYDRVDYVGFSMGGMLLYVALGRSLPEAWLRRVVIIGSPIRIGVPLPFSRSPLARLLARLPIPTVPLRLVSSVFARLAEAVRTPLDAVFYNRDNVAAGYTRLSLVNVIADVPGSLLRDLARWATTRRPLRLPDGRTLPESLSLVSVPVQFFAGAADHLAPPRAVRRAYLAWGRGREGVVARYTLLGRRTGAAADYGHGDLAIGRHLDEDLHEPAREFLDAELGSPFVASP